MPDVPEHVIDGEWTMQPWARSAVAVTALTTLVPAPADGASRATYLLRQNALELTTPTSVALGSAAPGGSISHQMGTVKVDDTRLVLANWTATVSSTNFITGGGSAAETIAKAQISYWSGPVTASSGLGVRTPGQLTALNAVTLASPRTAFSMTTSALGTSTSWNPTLVVAVPAAAVAGGYTGTVTHSVA